ncbi:hypothetical protein C8R47DRAFT_1101119 [Mycena vitilis]|nr:hypothetical protein C8R47DRAFT_1101119 [Mycena vitilis]
MLVIPPEVNALICAAVEDPTELVTLCRTSCNFRDQAQRILYHRVDLNGRPMRSVSSWALAVTRHPHLAERVHALALQLPETLKLSPSDGSKIKGALAACVNLKELRVSCAEVYAHGHPDSIHGWMINDAPFRLTKFANSYFNFNNITDFFDAQSEIRVLSISGSHGYGSILSSDTQIPELIALSVPSLNGLPIRRPLQRLETRFQRDYSPLGGYSATLTTLNLVRERVDWHVSLSDTIIIIAGLLPALAHLGVSELIKHTGHQPIIERTPMATLQRFLRLETFVLIVRNISAFRDPISVHVYDMEKEEEVEELGSAIMTACPTLNRVTVGAQVDREFTCTFARTSDGRIWSNRGNEIKPDSLSVFWDP